MNAFRQIKAFAAVMTAAFVFTPSAQAKETPAAASQIVSAAVRQAKASHKTVLVHFGATWCGWCKKLEAVLADPSIQKTLRPHLVIVKLDVAESPAKKNMENPGADTYLQTWGGAKSGLPFYVFLDGAGHKIADSNVMPGSNNIGFPGTPQELAAFDALLAQAAPRLSKADHDKILARLKLQNASVSRLTSESKQSVCLFSQKAFFPTRAEGFFALTQLLEPSSVAQ